MRNTQSRVADKAAAKVPYFTLEHDNEDSKVYVHHMPTLTQGLFTRKAVRRKIESKTESVEFNGELTPRFTMVFKTWLEKDNEVILDSVERISGKGEKQAAMSYGTAATQSKYGNVCKWR